MINRSTRKGYQPYDGRMRAMLMIAVIPLVVLAAQPLGAISYRLPVLLTGIGGMAGGIGGVIVTKTGGALAYLIAGSVVKALVPKYRPITNL